MSSVGIDCRFARFHAGLGRYTRALVTELCKRDDGISYTLFVHSADEPWLQSLQIIPNIVEAPFEHYSLAEQTKFPHIIHESGVDMLFSTHFNVPVRLKIPFVVTVHDLILHRYPNQASPVKRLAYRYLMKHAVKNASAIIAVSDYTASHITKVYGREVSSKVRRIYEGVEGHFVHQSLDEQERIRNQYALEKPYFLYVGNAKQHKRVPMLLEAFRRADIENMELILVTGGKESEHLPRLPHVRLLHNVPDENLLALYSAATAFVTASAYEGFGLPALEAQACGTPVIACKTSALPEVCLDGCVLTEDSVQKLSYALKQPLHAYTAPESLPFSWQKAAEETAEVLANAV